MARGARTVRQRSASLVVKVEAEVAAEADRLAHAARMSRDAYFTNALRHYNRLHALSKRQRIRAGGDRRVVLLFPPPSATGAARRPAPHKQRHHRDSHS